MLRKLLLVWVGLALAFAAAGASASYVRAAEPDCKNPSTLKFGRMGVVASGVDFACRVRVRAVNPDAAPAMKGGSLARSVMSLRSRQDRNDRSVFESPAYIYFDLSPSEASAWRSGKLQVMVYNSVRNQWESVSSSRMEGGSGGRLRIGSPVSRFGLYGLRKTK